MTRRDALNQVAWLDSLTSADLDELAAQSEQVTFGPGRTLLTELELGEDLFILVEGTARASVTTGPGEHRDVGIIHPGDACGEISLCTRQLHLATVTAVTDVVALKLDHAVFDRLVSRHPKVLAHFARRIASLVAQTDAALDRMLDESADRATAATEPLAGQSPAIVHTGVSIRRAWNELVVSRRRQLPFYALLAFVVALIAVRTTALAVEGKGVALFDFLRAAYMTGIALVFVSTAASLMRFRRSVQVVVAIVYGAGFALILNELSVFLAFDTFYLDMTTPDPNLVFDVENLYRRSESHWAILIALAFLAQLLFLRPFYRRCAFVVGAYISTLTSEGKTSRLFRK